MNIREAISHLRKANIPQENFIGLVHPLQKLWIDWEVHPFFWEMTPEKWAMKEQLDADWYGYGINGI